MTTTLRRLLLAALIPLAACGAGQRAPERVLGPVAMSGVCSPFQTPPPAADETPALESEELAAAAECSVASR